VDFEAVYYKVRRNDGDCIHSKICNFLNASVRSRTFVARSENYSKDTKYT
jgi:hypothetical protein